VELIETSILTRQINALFSDEEYRGFQSRIAANPGLGVLIKGGGGIRKLRVAVGSRGKSGGARVIYYWAVRREVILLLHAYLKNMTADLTPKQMAHR
jgi:hypothetical protein